MWRSRKRFDNAILVSIVTYIDGEHLVAGHGSFQVRTRLNGGDLFPCELVYYTEAEVSELMRPSHLGVLPRSVTG